MCLRTFAVVRARQAAEEGFRSIFIVLDAIEIARDAEAAVFSRI